MVGSAMLWSWLDALFMSAFFIRPNQQDLMPEIAVIAVFACSLPAIGFSLASKSRAEGLLANKRLLVGTAIAGTTGSLLLILSDLGGGWAALILGALSAGGFMGVYQLAWGATYAHDGIRSAAPFVAGGFACAVVVDTPLLLMIPQAQVVFFALLPLLSCAFLLTLRPELRTYRAPEDESRPRTHGVPSRLKRYGGVSLTLLGAVALIMIGFGYVQHLVSFSYVAGASQTGGIIIQLARGLSSVLMFAVIATSVRRAGLVCRVGLLAMIAGFMLMPFLFSTNLFWMSGAVLIAGYTALDLFLWVTFSQIAHAQSRQPLKTVALLRLIAVIGYIFGAVVGIALVGNGGRLNEFVSAETTVVGYLVVIATVLLLGAEDVWALFRTQAPTGVGICDEGGIDRRLQAVSETLALTAREQEIAALLAYGRTQPWIAEHLSISENTVSTHVRHIYQKANVHNRQEFIDLIVSPDQELSPESRE
ncbi:helix-turn-helix transcriptional regulator [Gordonibacter sp.]|uniref:helix-turn-helix transcriptional regulator n=1 Tax=Gordonibacter sp. TaxID=1968902 RepID=UPI002FC9A1DA